MAALLEDSLKATRSLHRVIISISVITLVFAFSLRRPTDLVELEASLDQLMEFDFTAYDRFVDEQVATMEAARLAIEAKEATASLDEGEHLVFSLHHIGEELGKSAHVGRFKAGDTLLDELEVATLNRLAILDDAFELDRNPQILVPRLQELVASIRDFLDQHGGAGKAVANVRVSTDSEFSGDDFVGPDTVVCSLYFELREVGTIMGAPTFNASYIADVVEVPDSSFVVWLQRQDIEHIVQIEDGDLAWLPQLEGLRTRDRDAELGPLRLRTTLALEEAGPQKQSVSFLGTTIPGILITLAAPLALFFLSYYFSNHVSHLRRLWNQLGTEARQFAWMPLSLPRVHAQWEMLWSVILLPVGTLVVLWVRLSQFESMGIWPVGFLSGGIIGVFMFGLFSHQHIIALRDAMDDEDSRPQLPPPDLPRRRRTKRRRTN